VGKLMNSCPRIMGLRNGKVLQNMSKVVSMARTDTDEFEAGRFRSGCCFG
jgi:hypothetical protein